MDAYAVGAVPAFITLLATRRAFGPAPDFVLSGINRGANTGHAVLHSGTVGAALTGATHGCRAAAISIAVETDKPIRWATAAHVVRRMVPWIMGDTISTMFNINVPNCDLENLRGIREARLARFGAVQTNVVERGEGFVRLAVADTNSVLEEGTDAALLTHGYATVTALEPLCATISTGLTRFLSRSDRT